MKKKIILKLILFFNNIYSTNNITKDLLPQILEYLPGNSKTLNTLIRNQTFITDKTANNIAKFILKYNLLISYKEIEQFINKHYITKLNISLKNKIQYYSLDLLINNFLEQTNKKLSRLQRTGIYNFNKKQLKLCMDNYKLYLYNLQDCYLDFKDKCLSNIKKEQDLEQLYNLKDSLNLYINKLYEFEFHRCAFFNENKLLLYVKPIIILLGFVSIYYFIFFNYNFELYLFDKIIEILNLVDCVNKNTITVAFIINLIVNPIFLVFLPNKYIENKIEKNNFYKNKIQEIQSEFQSKTVDFMINLVHNRDLIKRDIELCSQRHQQF